MGRPPMAPGQRRQRLHCRVSPSTLKALGVWWALYHPGKALNVGRALDEMVEVATRLTPEQRASMLESD